MEPIECVAVVVKQNGRVLYGLRHGSHAAGEWGLPGGKVDAGETLEECVVRETYEETELQLANVQDLGIESLDHFGYQVFRTQFFSATADGEPVIVEANKCLEWRWCEWGHQPTPLMAGTEALTDAGYRPFDD